MIYVPIKFKFFNYTDKPFETPFILSSTIGRMVEQSLTNRYARYEVQANAYEQLASALNQEKWIDVPFDDTEIARSALGMVMGKYVIMAITALTNNGEWTVTLNGIVLYYTEGALSSTVKTPSNFTMNYDLLDNFDIFTHAAQLISTFNNKGDTMQTPEGHEQYPGLTHVKRHNVSRKLSIDDNGNITKTAEEPIDDYLEGAKVASTETESDASKGIPLYRAAALAVSRLDLRQVISHLYVDELNVPSQEEREVMMSVLTDNIMAHVMEFCDNVTAQMMVGDRAITGKIFTVALGEKQAKFVCFIEPGPIFSVMFTPVDYSQKLTT